MTTPAEAARAKIASLPPGLAWEVADATANLRRCQDANLDTEGRRRA